MSNNVNWIQAGISAVVLVGALGGVWSTTQSRLAVLDQKVQSLIHADHKIVTEREWAEDHAAILILTEKVAVVERDSEKFVELMKETNEKFAAAINESTAVLWSSIGQ